MEQKPLGLSSRTNNGPEQAWNLFPTSLFSVHGTSLMAIFYNVHLAVIVSHCHEETVLNGLLAAPQ